MTQTVLAEWGAAGAAWLRGQVAALVVVDVLSFCTAVDVAVSRGAAVVPCAPSGPAALRAAARAAGAVLAQPRAAGAGQFSLSPASLQTIAAGTRLLLPSPNGAALSAACAGMPVLAGCLRNAAAVAAAALRIAQGGCIGVVPAGERWPDGSLRPAIEDLLGAGAVVHHLGLPCSAEAQMARDAFRAAGADVAGLVRGSISGRELLERGFAADVSMAVQGEASRCAPVLQGGAYGAFAA